MFDEDQPSMSGAKGLQNELERYLNEKPDPMVRDSDVLLWWKAHHHEFPWLYQMVINYHTIAGGCILYDTNFVLNSLTVTSTATSIDVEHVFNKGHLILSYILNSLSADSTCQLMCLGTWSHMGYIKDQNIRAVTLTEVELEDTGQNSYEW
jgi:hypothetical protein